MKRFFIFLTALLTVFCFSCKKEEQKTFDVMFEVPGEIVLEADAVSMDFRVMFGKSPEMSDKIVFGEPGGAQHTCDILAVSEKKVTVSLWPGMISGAYDVYVARGAEKKLMGTMLVTLSDGLEPDEGVTVYGTVVCGDKGVKDVVVSDGYEVVRTDDDGVYMLRSEKRHRYVFISVPSGYDVPAKGILPLFHKQLSKSAGTPERVDFQLEEAGDQTEHTMLVFGDIHLADRGPGSNNDMAQFREFTDDVNAYLSGNKGRKIYAMTLGDMTWDLYWVSKSFGLEEYVEEADRIKGLRIFHTIGNHDHEMEAAGDFSTVVKYKRTIAPTYYSFNIGRVHYVVLDDIECTNDGSGDRDYVSNVVSEQIDWLEKDLSYVPKDMQVVVAMHAPLYTDSGSASLDSNSSAALLELLKGYKVHFVTGHTHKMYNVDKLESDNVYEHNSGAVCATWWWTGKNVPGINISQDGTPGGYRIFNVSGTDLEWVYKPTGKSVDVQFRTYDGNCIDLSADKWIPDAESLVQLKYKVSWASKWQKASSDNYVYINVWDYDPEWEVSVTENGSPLKVTKISAQDPLHVLSYTIPSIQGNGKEPTFPTSPTKHIFEVQASSASSVLEIKVKDRFRNVYTETMRRPKQFSTDTYK